MPVLDLEPVRADVVLGLAELADDLEVRQAGLLAGLAQGGGFRGLTGADAACGHLDADLLIGVVGVAEHQQASVADNVDEDLLFRDLLGHGGNLHLVQALVRARPAGGPGLLVLCSTAIGRCPGGKPRV